MKRDQEQWIDEIMGSLQQMQPAEGNPHLHTRVMARLQNPINRQPIQLKWVYATVTVFIFMLVLNVLGWNASTTNEDSISTIGIETVINEYDLENNYTSLP
jgi:cytochrome b561